MNNLAAVLALLAISDLQKREEKAKELINTDQDVQKLRAADLKRARRAARNLRQKGL